MRSHLFCSAALWVALWPVASRAEGSPEEGAQSIEEGAQRGAELATSAQTAFRRPSLLAHADLVGNQAPAGGFSLNAGYAPLDWFFLRLGYVFSARAVEVNLAAQGEEERLEERVGTTQGLALGVGGLFGGEHSFELMGGLSLFWVSASIKAHDLFGRGRDGQYVFPAFFSGYRYQSDSGAMLRAGIGYTGGFAGGLVIGGGFGFD